ncbi:hypothetical protein J2X11_001699 [Aeromicrobium panaciterrae]|uniref:Uncharacterized protein n=1 Tax=Aeromicrobium panaciterrae TaxID=363861 RepID=A0ABU1UNX6_9ACTN|nr:hypothetical protein [Aeromicrobium panaciterrae]MDR7086860.1 hypothetical protein [Aeromicrobium panaciterrae]
METRRIVKHEVNSYSEILTDHNIAQFLATRNWTCQQDLGYAQTWIHPELIDGRAWAVQLPRSRDLADYQRRLEEAVSDLGRVYDWRVSEVAEQVASIHADLFFLRLAQSSKDGTIPLQQASSLLDGITQMIRSAALTAHSPTHPGRGRLPGSVSEFLEEDVRMGHTKKGSFIITVAARLDTQSQSAEGSSRETGEHVAPMSPASSVPMSYTRQVMTTFARSLDATQRTIVDAVDAPTFEDAVESGMKLPLVHALQEIGSAEGLQKLDMKFEWSALEPMQEQVKSHIEIDHASFGALESIELKLRKRVVPTMQEIVGPVIELKRAEEPTGADDEGEIVIRADVLGRLVKVTVPLAGEEYDWAIRAHRAKLPFTVTGELGKKGNSWRLVSDIAVDTEFLIHRLGRPATPQKPADSAE